MSMLRVAWLVYGDLDQPTGGYVYDRIVVGGLRAAGVDVTVLDPRRASPEAIQADAVVGDALCVPDLRPWFIARPRTARVLLVHHLPSWELERAADEGARLAEATAIASCDACVATGVLTGARLAREHPAVLPVVVVPGADRLRPPRRPATPSREPPVRLVFIGSLLPRKRVHELLDAFEPIAASRAVLSLIGDPSRDPEYAGSVHARVAKSSVLRATVTCEGVLGDEALAQVLDRADALVLPSSLEGYGMAAVEALRAGVPVLASHEAATAAGLDRHPAVGVLGNPSAWTWNLAAFVDDPVTREARREAARAESWPRWTDAVEAFRVAITDAVAARGAKPRGPVPAP